MRNIKMVLPVLGLLCLLGSSSVQAHAHRPFAVRHPRRAHIIHRDKHQLYRVNQLVHEHRLTGAQARRIEAEDHGIRRQEQRDAKLYHGHITKAQEKQLNHELNEERREILQDEYKDAHK